MAKKVGAYHCSDQGGQVPSLDCLSSRTWKDKLHSIICSGSLMYSVKIHWLRPELRSRILLQSNTDGTRQRFISCPARAHVQI